MMLCVRVCECVRVRVRVCECECECVSEVLELSEVREFESENGL